MRFPSLRRRPSWARSPFPGSVLRRWHVSYTGKGDDGTTGLLYGGRVPKDDPRPEALGTVDEAQAAIGLARAGSARSPMPPS